jgi:broad specificity phosphatase PhoE
VAPPVTTSHSTRSAFRRPRRWRSGCIILQGSSPAAILPGFHQPRPAVQADGAALGLTAHADPGLDDWDLGRWRGRSLETVTADQAGDVGTWLADPDAVPRGVESLNALIIGADSLLAQLEEAADGLAPQCRRPWPVTVTHPAVIRADRERAAGKCDLLLADRLAPLTATTPIGHHGRWNLRATGQPPDSSPCSAGNEPPHRADFLTPRRSWKGRRPARRVYGATPASASQLATAAEMRPPCNEILAPRPTRPGRC